GKSLSEIAGDAKNYPSLERAAAKLAAFSNMLDSARALLETETLPDFYDQLIRMTGYEDMLLAKGNEESLARLDSIRELKSSIVNYVEQADEPTLAGFLEEVSLFTDIEQYDPDANAVVMMTMHAAKGLEFPHVMLVGFEEGLFPGAASMSDRDELEEERRLCYVAITRAMKTLSISYAQRRMLYGRTSYNRPSCFLAELPSSCVMNLNAPKAAPAPRREQAAPKPKRDYSSLVADKPAAKKPVAYSQGDMVEHKAFGKGMVLSVLPMGNDALMEIAFDNVGTKRLMANTAERYLQKI
ncbi:MAG: ATP-binding domain-containing protein, partial [Oscillospiraceae bacterium]|nr:ATP-binding domain-containing protein [Oscillospiraceae bacterium]